MKTLLVIFSHSGANATVQRHWPLYERSACDILGVGRVNTQCQWPDGRRGFIGSIDVGVESYASGDNHIVRVLRLIEHFLTEPTLKVYSHLIITEYDGVWFGPPPQFNPDTFYAKLAGGGSPGFLGSQYVHTPWAMDRLCAGRILKYGKAMHRAGLIERGFLDRWFGLMIDLYDLQWRDTGAGTYSRNTIEPCHFEEFRTAIQSGIWYAHGLKTTDCLKVAIETDRQKELQPVQD